jgi:hypothetical protein
MRSQTKIYVVLVFSLYGLSGCDDDCTTYSINKLNCSQIANANYNVHFTLPDENEILLGKTAGLSKCAAKASNYAKMHAIPKQYVCCMITETSSCAEKHR